MPLRPSRATILGAIVVTLLGVGFVTSQLGCPGEKDEGQDKRRNSRTPFMAKVLAVTDGDTLRLEREGPTLKVRLHGVDAPERAQAYGQAARRFVSARVLGKRVRVTPKKKRDRYGRLVATIAVGGEDLGELLLNAGLAWHYARYAKSDKLARLQREARAAKRGLWATASPTAPWDWRRARRGKAKTSRPPPKTTGKVLYRGNTRSKIFHHKNCTHFTCANCQATFASAGDAVAAGYRPHRRCVRHSFRLP
ncbi:MAG: thermonuclease family protein [Deltaproteobacteria bacterium]|nr:thermonuclease family protein [Deltaproteobacteria bacterium]